MTHERSGSSHELYGIIETRLMAMVTELEDGGWNTAEVASVTRDILKARWLDRLEALQAAREEVPENFLSDGNEG